jgi:hypothetical protein
MVKSVSITVSETPFKIVHQRPCCVADYVTSVELDGCTTQATSKFYQTESDAFITKHGLAANVKLCKL